MLLLLLFLILLLFLLQLLLLLHPFNGLISTATWVSRYQIVRGRFYSSCVRSSMLHGSETWPITKENEVALQRAEMSVVRWMCVIKLQDKVESKELRETRIRCHNIGTTAEQVAMVWAYAAKRRQRLGEEMHEYEVERARPKENLERDCGKTLSGM